MPTLLAVAHEAQELASTDIVFPDERLKPLVICTHPAIDAAARMPLMLQTVQWLDAACIAAVASFPQNFRNQFVNQAVRTLWPRRQSSVRSSRPCF